MSNIVNRSNPNIGQSTISNDDIVICFDFVKFARLENLNFFSLFSLRFPMILVLVFVSLRFVRSFHINIPFVVYAFCLSIFFWFVFFFYNSAKRLQIHINKHRIKSKQT